MCHFCLRAVVTLLLTTTLNSKVWAEGASGPGSQFGAMYGLSVADSDNTVAHRFWGVKGMAFLSPVLSVGGYYLKTAEAESSGGQRFDYSIHGIEAAYHILTNTGDTSLAARVGLSKVETVQSNTDLIFSPYHWGVAVSYDYFLTSWFSLGFEGSYLHAEQGKTTVSGTDYRLDSFNFINFMVSVMLRL